MPPALTITNLTAMNDESLKSTVAQRYLTIQGFYRAAIDGVWGPISIAAAAAWAQQCRSVIAPRLLHPNDKTIILEQRGSIGFLRTIAAQLYLADLKLYIAAIDGAWGPLSREAARTWLFIQPRPNITPPPEPLPHLLTPYSVAKRYIGTREIPGKTHCGVILSWYRRLQIAIYDDETPWCSTFVNFCAAEAGYERTGKLNARSWLDIGERIDLSEARSGKDVLIFTRGNSSWQGHVGFFAGFGTDKRHVRCLGGNQNDSVNITTMNASTLLGVRRLRSLDMLQGSSNKI